MTANLIMDAVMTEQLHYTDATLRNVLSNVRTIAMVGASADWKRPSFFISFVAVYFFKY